MSHRSPRLDAFYRFALGGYIVTLVLAIYAGTSDPSIHVKDLLTSWAAGVLAGSYVLVAWLVGKPLKRPVIFLEVLLCFLGFMLLGTLFSAYYRFSLLELGQFFSLFALYWLAAQIYSTPAQVLRFFAAFCGAVFVAGLYAVLQRAGLDPFPWGDTTSDTYTNLPATFGNPNYAAHAIILAVVMLVCLVRAGYGWIGWVMAPVLFFHLYSTDQRAGWVALAGTAVLVALAWLLVRKTRRPLLAVTSTLLLFAGAGLLGAGATMYWTHARTGHYFPLDLSLLLRYQSYVSASNMLFDSPVVGHGPAVYGLAYPPYWTPFEQEWFAQEGRMNEHVHNDILELGIDGGLAAAGLYLAMLVLGLCYGLLLIARGPTGEHRRLGYAFAAFFCAFAIDGLFGFNLRVPVTAALFFLMMGLLDGLWSGARAVPAEAPPARRGLAPALKVAFVVLLFLTTWQETRRFTAEYYFYQGMRAQHRGQFSDAETAYRTAAGYADWNWNIPRRLGLLELERRRPQEALSAFQVALDRNPHYFLTHLPMAQANLMLAQAAVAGQKRDAAQATSHLDAARNHAEQVIALCPNYPGASDTLGRIESIAAIVNRDYAAEPDPAVQAAHWERARQLLQGAIDRGASNAGELYRMLVQVETSMGNIDGAEQALRGALQAEPDEERTWPLFMTFAREHQRFAQLRDTLYRWIDQLSAADPESEVVTGRLATAYRWLAAVLEEGFNDIDGAADALASAVQHGSQRPELWHHYANFVRKHGRDAELAAAVRTSCAAVADSPADPLPQVAAVNAVLEDPAGQLDQASRVLLAGVRPQFSGGARDLQVTYGWAAQLLIEAYDELATAGTAPCESALNLGAVSASLNQLDRAKRLLERAMACLTDERRAYAAIYLADALTRLNAAEEALAVLRESEGQFPDHLDTQLALARNLVQLKRSDEAAAIYDGLLQHPEITEQGRAQITRERALLDDGKP